MDASSPQRAFADGRPRRSGAWSTTSSWMSVAMCRRIGRRRLPPAPAMNSPISWIRCTGEAISAAIASSMARISAPTARATRSLRSASSGVGAFTGGTRSADDDPVLDLDLVAVGDAGELDHGELVLDLGDATGGHLLVELAEQLTRHRMHDGDLVPAHADLGTWLDPVLAVEVDHHPARVHEHDEAAIVGQPGWCGGRLRPRLGRRARLGRRRRGIHGHRHLLPRADAAAPGRRAVLGHDLGGSDEAALTEDERTHGRGNLVLLDPDVLGLTCHVAEPGILDE